MTIENGYLREPSSDKYWSFEDELKGKMVTLFDGDVDLRPWCSPRSHQKRTGSCVGQAIVNALELKRILKYGADAHIDLSPMMLYYVARSLMVPPEVDLDKGTFIYLACDAIRKFGVCTEDSWKFKLKNLYKKPSMSAFEEASHHKIESHYKIMSEGNDRVDEVIASLRAGNPVVFGTEVGKEWKSYRKFPCKVLEPLGIPETTISSHATTIVGYKDGLFIGENSWGEKWWGLDGFYKMQPEVIASPKSRDFWVIQAGFEDLK